MNEDSGGRGDISQLNSNVTGKDMRRGFIKCGLVGGRG